MLVSCFWCYVILDRALALRYFQISSLYAFSRKSDLFQPQLLNKKVSCYFKLEISQQTWELARANTHMFQNGNSNESILFSFSQFLIKLIGCKNLTRVSVECHTLTCKTWNHCYMRNIRKRYCYSSNWKKNRSLPLFTCEIPPWGTNWWKKNEKAV